MPCIKCNTDFNMFNWKLKCIECEEYHCSKCLTKQDGYIYCEVCSVLIARPPDRSKLMDLKSKDLQHYLSKNNISTHGLVEKQELVELFFKNMIPIKHRRNARKFPASIGGSVPNLTARSQLYLSNLKSNAEAALNNLGQPGHSAHTSPNRNYATTSSTDGPPPPPRGLFAADRETRVPNSNGYHYETQHRPTNRQNQMPNVNHFNREAQNRTTNRENQVPNHNSTAQNQNTPPPFASAPPHTGQASKNIPPQRIKKYRKIFEFKTIEELNDLSVKELKELLALNRVDFKGCVEKAELVERANMLWIDSNAHRGEDKLENIEETCKICMDAPLDCVLLECGHIATCLDCGKKLSECPICRQYVIRVVRTFKA